MSSGTSGLTDSLAQDISQEELDFSDLFLYNAAEEAFTADTANPGLNLHNDSHPPSLVVHQPVADLGADHAASNQGFRSANIGIIPAPSPRIEITPSGDSLSLQPLEPSPRSQALGGYREQPCASPASSNSSTGWPADGYSPLVSPCVSPNGGGCAAGLSALDLCPGLQGVNSSSAQSSPGASPRTSITDETYLVPQQQRTNSPLHHQRSRSASPQGKRTYDQYCSPALGATPVKQCSRSPSPSTHEQQGTYYLHHHHQGQAEPPPHQARASSPSLEAMLRNLSSSPARVAPSNMGQGGDEGYACGQRQDYVYGDGQDWAVEQDRRRRAEDDVKPEAIYILPSMWSPYTAPYRTISGFPTAPLSSLDWPLPSQSGPYELVIHQQPRSHHRAHYETEGSRGAVKTPSGGHPVVQLHGYQGSTPLGLQVFIGTADERVLKPHAFYQVHRITGKTVTTPSLERMVNGTKFLEIPLEPKAHMKAVIDCAGILKLRNADIELRNGETDVGRKNTRVRLVFRVHVPQQDGQFVSLQAASHPIECSQRSAQELPAVERQNLDRCSVLGGQQMVLTGQNFTSESKVIFSEKTQDGQKLWEVEATVDRDKTQSNMLFVEVPPYRDPAIYHPAKVNFYVINGKKKRSQPQHFIYTPMIAIKAEPLDDYQFSLYSSAESHALSMSPKSFYHPSHRDSFSKAINISPTSYLLSNQDQESRGLTQQFLEDTPVYYPSRASPLNNSPVLYYGANQQSNLGTSPLRGFPAQKLNSRLQQCHYPAMVSCLSTTPLTSQCVGTEFPVADLEQGEDVYPSMAALSQGDSLFETPSLARYVQTISPLGKLVSSRYIQDPAPEKRGTRVEPAGPLQTLKHPGAGVLCDRVPEKVTVKQENLNHAYLEDVNDIIKRDLKCHHGECS